MINFWKFCKENFICHIILNNLVFPSNIVEVNITTLQLLLAANVSGPLDTLKKRCADKNQSYCKLCCFNNSYSDIHKCMFPKEKESRWIIHKACLGSRKRQQHKSSDLLTTLKIQQSFPFRVKAHHWQTKFLTRNVFLHAAMGFLSNLLGSFMRGSGWKF